MRSSCLKVCCPASENVWHLRKCSGVFDSRAQDRVHAPKSYVSIGSYFLVHGCLISEVVCLVTQRFIPSCGQREIMGRR
jgi:hypothetical protein